MTRWQDLQGSIWNCRMCQRVEGTVFRPFNENWPALLEPRRKAILFISEAPPPGGGFWTNARPDDLREKLLRLLKLSSSGEDRGLTAFCSAGYYLLQSFPRPLKSSIAGIRYEDLKFLLEHPVKTHLYQQIEFLQPSAILALGRPASTAVSLLWPRSTFAVSFQEGGGKLQNVRGKIFEDSHLPILSATHLPSGNGRFWREFWRQHIPLFVEKVRSQA